jgi:cellulose synthase/poly-beta-1,6-N-acetylglucosamine synthase-like glycosyltransferase
MQECTGQWDARETSAARRAHNPRMYDYSAFEAITGALTEPAERTARVRLRRLPGAGSWRTRLAAALVVVVQTVFVVWVVQPEHAPHLSANRIYAAASIAMAVSIVALEIFRLINIGTLCLASARARDPIPMEPDERMRVAFLTTIVPGKEPLDMVRRTLEAALRIRHRGRFHVWLLDEGNEPAVRSMCAELGVHHFSRRGVEHWNQPTGRFKAKTKHGNYNAWLDRHGSAYDLFVSVDPDHVPRESFCERLIGYFRDPDVAFVVAPQVYGNYDEALVTRCAESQQFVFHGLVQRLGNAFGCPMFVGTNNAVRIAAVQAIGGLQDSITEDMATSLAWHAQRNPATGARWRSVYTPDVVAVGEGPTTFTDFFTQQHRWSAGTFAVLRSDFWRRLRRMNPGRALHHLLITAYYPTAAIGWIVGAFNCVLYLGLGTMGVRVPAEVWIAVYLDLAFVQFCFYGANRKHNVSPHEPRGSAGAAGMLISVLTAPVYVQALLGAIVAKNAKFVVTPKGDARSVDRLVTFRWHLRWAGLLAVALAAALWQQHTQAGMYLWGLTLLGACLAPLVIWRVDASRTRRSEVPALPPAIEPRQAIREELVGAA